MPANPELLQRLSKASDGNTTAYLTELYALLPANHLHSLPAWGVAAGRDWLRAKFDEDSFEFRLLASVQVDDDDQGWSVDDVHQGGLRDLIKWIAGTRQAPGYSFFDLTLEFEDTIRAELAAAGVQLPPRDLT